MHCVAHLMLVMQRLTHFVAHLMLVMVLNLPEQCSFQDLLFHLLFMPKSAEKSASRMDISLVCVCFLPIHSGHQVRWTYQPGSHRRKVTQDF